jgi:hypothetical protein
MNPVEIMYYIKIHTHTPPVEVNLEKNAHHFVHGSKL